MKNYKMVYIHESVIEKITGTPFGDYLDRQCCCTYGRNVAYMATDRTLKRLKRDFNQEMKGGLIKILA